MTTPTRADAVVDSDARVPVVIGVVGHNDPAPEAIENIQAAVHKILELFRKRYKDTPVQVLSSLAEGSDRIGAQVALEIEGCSVVAPLPFPASVYAESSSFSSPMGADDVLTVGSHGKVPSFVVPLPKDQPKDEDGWRILKDSEEGRNKCFANAGGYIVQHCLVLIALWEGEEEQDEIPETKKTGLALAWAKAKQIVEGVMIFVGLRTARSKFKLKKRRPNNPSVTEQMVRFMTLGESPEGFPGIHPLRWSNEVGPVIAIQTPRIGRTYRNKPSAGWIHILVPPEGDVIERWVWERRPSAWRWFFRRAFGTFGARFKPTSRNEFWKYREILRGIDGFNRDVGRAGRRARKDNIDATTRLLGIPKSKLEWDERWVPLGKVSELERVASVWAASSDLASWLDFRLKWCLRILFLGLFLALAVFHAYAHPIELGLEHLTHNPQLLGTFIVMLLGLAVLVGVVWYLRMDERRLDYRALSEALRVRYFWALAGLTKSVAATYMGQLEGEMSLARRVLYGIAPPPEYWKRTFDDRTPDEQKKCFEAVANRWVSHQKAYYHDAHRHYHRLSSFLRVTGVVLAFSGWGVSIWLLTAGWLLRREHAAEPIQTAMASVAASGAKEVAIPSIARDASGKFIASKLSATAKPPDAQHPESLVLIASSLLVIGGGLIIAYSERRSYESLARQYGNALTVFDRGERDLKALLEHEQWHEARNVICELGIEALVEHAQWLVLHRVHPFEMVFEG